MPPIRIVWRESRAQSSEFESCRSKTVPSSWPELATARTTELFFCGCFLCRMLRFLVPYPAFLCHLAGAAQRERFGGDIFGDGGAGADVSLLANTNRRDQS